MARKRQDPRFRDAEREQCKARMRRLRAARRAAGLNKPRQTKRRQVARRTGQIESISP
jgi:hypothetical protein